MNTETWLAVLNVRYTKCARARDAAIERDDMDRADDWHARCLRYTNAIAYLESRLERGAC
jgi:hypothetical protein